MKIEFKEYEDSFAILMEANTAADAAKLARFALQHEPSTISVDTWVHTKNFVSSICVSKHGRRAGFIPNAIPKTQ